MRTSATSGTGAACRRGGCGTPSHGGNGVARPPPPSWCWAGWGTEGWQNLKFDARIADDHFTIRWHDCEISPLVLDWATGDRCNMAPSDRRPVRFYRDWAELRNGYRGKQNTSLPAGWSCHQKMLAFSNFSLEPWTSAAQGSTCDRATSQA